ncbi:hypothetical protein SAMN05444360_102186 [Chryseobacterium carnipullorum]|uniref:hypothetical protein n=1 Tax=Chryseobacterium carnipullorum TaxID=1124835 RepID=UPI000921813B|nr:hypothetical protein [Chryseobacterium carnipullorum]SHL52544.1 hypothetical protein SAMN05444360_102186 [Chryseobacterium carnipullorum]
MSINQNNPLNDPETRRLILNQLSIKELNELANLIDGNQAPTLETWFKWNRAKNNVLNRRLKAKYISPPTNCQLN